MPASSFTLSHSLTPDEVVTRLNTVVFQEVRRELGDNMTDLRQEWKEEKRVGIFQFQAMGKPVTVRVSLLDGSQARFDIETVQEMGIILPGIKEEICRQAKIFLD